MFIFLIGTTAQSADEETKTQRGCVTCPRSHSSGATGTRVQVGLVSRSRFFLDLDFGSWSWYLGRKPRVEEGVATPSNRTTGYFPLSQCLGEKRRDHALGTGVSWPHFPLGWSPPQPSTLRTSQGSSAWLNSPRTQRATTPGHRLESGEVGPALLPLHSTPCLLWSGPTPTCGHLAPVVKDPVRELCLQERKAPMVGETLRCLRPAPGPRDGGATSGSWGHSSGSNPISTTDKHRP